MFGTIIGIIITVLTLATGCGKAPSLSDLAISPETQVAAAPEPGDTITLGPVVAAQPSPTPSPSASLTPAPTVVQYTNTNWNLICPAFHNFNPATTTIQINYPGYYYTFQASGVTYTLNGTTSIVGQATLLYGGGHAPGCTVTIQTGQLVGVTQ
jgi:hypothetical protein